MAKKYLLYIHDVRFEDEPRKSQLVNELLTNHYAGFHGLPNPRKDGLPPYVILPDAPPTKKPAIIKTPEDAIATVKAVFPDAKPLCKIHGTPLDGRGRCLQKGCKYS